MTTRMFLRPDAAIAQLGERQTEDLKVPSSILGLGNCFFAHADKSNALDLNLCPLNAEPFACKRFLAPKPISALEPQRFKHVVPTRLLKKLVAIIENTLLKIENKLLEREE